MASVPASIPRRRQYRRKYRLRLPAILNFNCVAGKSGRDAISAQQEFLQSPQVRGMNQRLLSRIKRNLKPRLSADTMNCSSRALRE